MPAIKSHTGKEEFEGSIRIDRETIDLIFPKYFVRLAFYANQFLNDEEKARDAVHNTFLALWEKRTNVEFGDERQLKSYLYKVTKNKAVDLVRESQKEQKELGRLSKNLDQAIVSPEEKDNAIILAEAIAMVRQAVKELPPQCRSVMELLLEGHTLDEVGAFLNMSNNTVRQNKFYAITALKKRFNDYALLSFVLLALGLYEATALS